MSLFLEQMRQSSKLRLEAARGVMSLEGMRRRAEMRGPIELPDGFLVIAEVKPVSPLEGSLATSGLVERSRSYESGGASVLSVLTEPTEFGGSLGLLEEVAGAVSLPVMRKDFIIDPYQVWEARAHGASGVLAIARMLDGHGLATLVSEAIEAEMFVLVELFDEEDLHVIEDLDLESPQVLLGVNCRDLSSLQVRERAHEKMAPVLPERARSIAESGIGEPERVKELIGLGYQGVLVGSSLMRAEDPDVSVAALVAAAEEST